MEGNRVVEILTSDQDIYVTFEGDSVWIDQYNPDEDTVLIHSVQTGAINRVPATRLHEQ